ncbi:MAG: PTS glucitol/sorbitol transporter subunit IIA [Selenomonadaceae bacterium]|nr:PTS glucitol/sorbitol transporter subunit IIA [Selenomonadaceae bacterium]MBR3747435.1 PTS glucitol/sorbitol transporter subunit IIA [Selenomonadaceae bacterium]
MKYHAMITGWGEYALDFLNDPKANCIIIFNNDAPPDLAEISVLHTKEQLLAIPAAGDTVIIGEKVFTITAVGEEAKSTLRELGHCTLSFKGGNVPERPGCIMLEGDEPLTAADIQVENMIEIY